MFFTIFSRIVYEVRTVGERLKVFETLRIGTAVIMQCRASTDYNCFADPPDGAERRCLVMVRVLDTRSTSRLGRRGCLEKRLNTRLL